MLCSCLKGLDIWITRDKCNANSNKEGKHSTGTIKNLLKACGVNGK